MKLFKKMSKNKKLLFNTLLIAVIVFPYFYIPYEISYTNKEQILEETILSFISACFISKMLCLWSFLILLSYSAYHMLIMKKINPLLMSISLLGVQFSLFERIFMFCRIMIINFYFFLLFFIVLIAYYFIRYKDRNISFKKKLYTDLFAIVIVVAVISIFNFFENDLKIIFDYSYIEFLKKQFPD